MMKCNKCRFGSKNNPTGQSCDNYFYDIGLSITCKFEPILQSGMKVKIRKDASKNIRNNPTNRYDWVFLDKDPHFKEGKILTLTFKKTTNKDTVCWFVSDSGFYYNEAWLEFYDDSIINTKDDKLKVKYAEETQKENRMHKYEFKGKLNLEVLISDALEENKRSFIVLGETNALVAIMKNTDSYFNNTYNDVYLEVDGNFYSNEGFVSLSQNHPFFFKIIEKSDVNNWIKFFKVESKEYHDKIAKQKRKIELLTRKGQNKGFRHKVFTF